MCVCPPPGYKNHSREIKSEYIANQTNPTAFQFLCMALAIDTIDGRGLSNKACRKLLPYIEEQDNTVFVIHYTVIAI